MRLPSKYSEVVLNLFIALAISLVVNFSYLILLLIDEPNEPSPSRVPEYRVEERAEVGVLRLSPDGHGYLLYPAGDSVYVAQQRVRWLRLQEGDSLRVSVRPRTQRGAHPILVSVQWRNGEVFDYHSLYNQPSELLEVAIQLLYYLVVAFVLLTILMTSRRNYSTRRFIKTCLWALLAAVGLYLLAPVTDWRTGRIEVNLMSNNIWDYMLLLKCSFAVVVSMLYVHIYILVSQRQAMQLENEQLKNENLTTRYNMLVGQINPHFFFNSLNSLAMLVREKQDEKALTYIDQLSYTFRYILQNGQGSLMTLAEELKFVEAYSYLLKIRYEDKLFFDIAVEERYHSCQLPALTLQPLIENAVKHNTITRSKPFHISLRAKDGWLEISNPKIPKLENEPSTGIGLENLRNRWHLIMEHEIEVVDDGERFTVRLPLLVKE